MSQCSDSLDSALSPVAILSGRTPERIAQRAEKKRWSNYRSVKNTKLIGPLSLRDICSHYSQHTNSATHMGSTCPAGPAFLHRLLGECR